MEAILPYIINAVLGGGGGFLGNMIKKNGMSLITNLLSGAVGGSILPQLGSMAGLLGGAAEAGGGMDIASMATALIGGGAGSMLGGLLGGNKGGDAS